MKEATSDDKSLHPGSTAPVLKQSPDDKGLPSVSVFSPSSPNVEQEKKKPSTDASEPKTSSSNPASSGSLAETSRTTIARKILPSSPAIAPTASTSLDAGPHQSPPNRQQAPGASAAGPSPSRPGTPLGRKALPASVSSTLAKQAAGSGSPMSRDKGAAGGPAPASAGQYPGMDNRPPKPGPTPSKLGNGASPSPTKPQLHDRAKAKVKAGDRGSNLDYKQRRKEEKKKRKLAAAGFASGGPGPSNVGVSAASTPSGSPASVRINGQSRHDSLPPNKQRRLDASPSITDAGASQGGLKVRLNGWTNRVSPTVCLSATIVRTR